MRSISRSFIPVTSSPNSFTVPEVGFILHPDFWGHIAAKLRPYDEIKVRCDDGTFYAQLLVLAGRGSASMLLGTVSQYVLRKAPCPVLVVPETGRDG